MVTLSGLMELSGLPSGPTMSPIVEMVKYVFGLRTRSLRTGNVIMNYPKFCVLNRVNLHQLFIIYKTRANFCTTQIHLGPFRNKFQGFHGLVHIINLH